MHNGDSRPTDMASEWTISVGRLLRKRYGTVAVVAGAFGLFQWSAVSRREWDDSIPKIKTPQAIDVSWEYAFNAANNDQNRLLLINKIMRKNIFF